MFAQEFEAFLSYGIIFSYYINWIGVVIHYKQYYGAQYTDLFRLSQMKTIVRILFSRCFLQTTLYASLRRLLNIILLFSKKIIVVFSLKKIIKKFRRFSLFYLTHYCRFFVVHPVLFTWLENLSESRR